MKWLCVVSGMCTVGESRDRQRSVERCQIRLDSVLRLNIYHVNEIRISYLTTGGRVVASCVEHVVIADTLDPAEACLSVVTFGRAFVESRE